VIDSRSSEYKPENPDQFFSHVVYPPFYTGHGVFHEIDVFLAVGGFKTDALPND
jgi:hypothetical protein